MDVSNSLNQNRKSLLAADNWRTNLTTTREQLKQSQKRLEQYRAALRLANVEIKQRNQGIIALTAFAYQANRVTNPADLLRLGLIQALNLTGASTGAVVLINTDTKILSLGVHKGLTPKFAKVLTGQDLEHGAAALMPHLVAGSGALLENAYSDDETERELLQTAKLTSLVSLPLQLRPKLMGAFLIGSHEKLTFTPAELYFLTALTQEVAMMLESIYLREGIWDTAQLFLGSGTLNLDQQSLDDTTLDVDDISAPFELPVTNSNVSMPDKGDLEQLLAAMMEAEDEVQQQNSDLQTLNTVAEMMIRTPNIKEMLSCAVEQTRETLGADAAWLYLLSEGYGQLELRAHVGLSKSFTQAMRRIELVDGVEGLAVTDNKPYFIQSIQQTKYPHKIWVDKEGIHGIAAVPITARPDQYSDSTSQVIGVLVTATIDQGEHFWTPRQMRLLTSIAKQVALAIDNARLYEKLQEAETGLRAGNAVLQNINDMLLEKNAFLEGFIHDDLVPALTTALPVLQHLFLADPFAFNDSQKQNLVRLQKIIDRLNIQAQETTEVSQLLGAEFAKMVANHTKNTAFVGPSTPVRLEKKPKPTKDLQPEKSPPPPKISHPATDVAVERGPMSFAEAVAAGLVPSDIINREQGWP